ILLKLKEEEAKAKGQPFDNRLTMYDFRYYIRIREEKEFGVDENLVKEYFPVNVVVQGALDIYQELLSLKCPTLQSVVQKDQSNIFDFFSFFFCTICNLQLQMCEKKKGSQFVLKIDSWDTSSWICIPEMVNMDMLVFAIATGLCDLR
ncbi:thimet oligopeptidase, partial [Reticulomyxa filosa]